MKTDYKICIFLKKIFRFSKRLDCVSFQCFRPYPCGKCSEPGFTLLCEKPIAQEKTDKRLLSEVF